MSENRQEEEIIPTLRSSINIIKNDNWPLRIPDKPDPQQPIRIEEEQEEAGADELFVQSGASFPEPQSRLDEIIASSQKEELG